MSSHGLVDFLEWVNLWTHMECMPTLTCIKVTWYWQICLFLKMKASLANPMNKVCTWGYVNLSCGHSLNSHWQWSHTPRQVRNYNHVKKNISLHFLGICAPCNLKSEYSLIVPQMHMVTCDLKQLVYHTQQWKNIIP